MGKKRTPADVFCEIVMEAASVKEDCQWVSEKLEDLGYTTSANSAYQRIRQLNKQCEEAGIDPFLAELKEDKNKSGSGGKKLNLLELSKKYTTQVPPHDPSKTYAKDPTVEK